ncbi:MAG: MipA/OmpV family protein [Betaproteobacteria bacterium]|nr:MipA/OmpV family protein [Betaproteobacteria bacterium]
MRQIVFCLAVVGSAVLISMPACANDEDPTLIGIGLRVRPAYEGANSNRGELYPVLRVYRGPLFARTTQGKLEGGARFSPMRGLSVGGQLAYEGGRLADESAFLKARGNPTVDEGLSIGAHVEYDTKVGAAPLTALARYRKHIDSDRGAQADVRVTLGFLDKAGFTAAAFGQLTVADRKEMRGYFGVSPSVAASSGLPAYEPDAGPRFLSGGVQGGYQLSKGFLLIGSAEVHRLVGDAASSPLVQRKSNGYVGIGIAYNL